MCPVWLFPRERQLATSGSKPKTSVTGGRNSEHTIAGSFVENRSSLKRFLTRFLNNQHDIEDVVQETYLRASQAETDNKIIQPQAFLFRVARNLALNQLKEKSRQITDYIEDCSSETVIQSTEQLETDLAAQQHLGLYCEAIASLPDKCRKVMLLRKVQGMRHKEIAERMGLSVSSVEKYLLKGGQEVQDYLSQRESGDGVQSPGPVQQQWGHRRGGSEHE